MQVDAHERKCQPFSWHLVVKLPALLLTTLAQDHGIGWQITLEDRMNADIIKSWTSLKMHLVTSDAKHRSD
ncbi:hypothetical protein P7K49_036829 [Saguinus oedipus]|uniref:Uncharacterized protein n=1 Tax=Saguinus oedipus TaxID=9490 RepID=A0ABQ9TL86_SAGOE|nr:hypothetical protein P7K49_036829 [Saguinus oedipus]